MVSIATFPVAEVRTQGTAGIGQGVGSGGLDAQLGTVVTIPQDVTVGSLTFRTNNKYMLVEANLAADDFDARGRLFKWQDRAAFQVRPANANADKIAGIGPYVNPMNPAAGTAGAAGLSSLDTTNYFWLCVEGEYVQVMHSDYFATDPLEGTTKFFMVADDDADLGKVAGTATFVSGSTVGRYVSGTAADNAIMIVALDALAAV